MMEESKDYIEIYPSYWIYNAGIFGIIRTLKNYNIKADDGFKIESGLLKVQKETWENLISIYPGFMSKNFNTDKRNWFNNFFSQKGNRIFQNNIDPNQLSGNTLYYLLDKDNLTFEEKVFLLFLSMESTNNAIKDITVLKEKKASEELESEINFVLGVLKMDADDIKEKIKSRSPKNKKYNFKSLLKILGNGCLFNKFKNLLSPVNRNTIYNCDFDNLDLNEIANSAGNAFVYKHLKKIECIDGSFFCAFCGDNTNNQSYFDMRWFYYEGGSKKGFPNFYWGDSTQMPICGKCQLVLYFSPLGIYSDSNTFRGEFINIPDIKYLWDLNYYRMSVYQSRSKEKWLKYEERSKLIDALVSTGAYLQLKSRWLMQNVEIIELGGKRKNTVYNIEIAPIPLKILSDHTSKYIAQWLSYVENIRIRKISNELYKKSCLYTRGHAEFTNGREIIEKFLNNDVGWINSTAILLFKLYFEEDKSKNPLNDFEKLFKYSLKPLLFLNLSLMKTKEAYSDFYGLGKSISNFFEGSKEKDTFLKKTLPPLFNCVYTLRKNNFIEILIRIYMAYQAEVDDRLLKILRLNNNEFQTESLLLIIGILEKIKHGENDE